LGSTSWLRDAGPLHWRHRPGSRGFRLLLGFTPQRGITHQELHAVIAQRPIPEPLPRSRKLGFVKTDVFQDAHDGALQLGGLDGIAELGDFLTEKIILALGKFDEPLLLLGEPALLRLEQLLLQQPYPLGRYVPGEITRCVLAGETDNVGQRFDVGKVAGLLILQRLQNISQDRLVLNSRVVRRLLPGGNTLELFIDFSLTTQDVALPQPLAFRNPLLCFAREAREQLLVRLGPRRR
jgi:hypothetical protein